MLREFDSYEEAKQYYVCMVEDRDKYRALSAEINRIDKVLQGKELRPGENLKDFITEERDAYIRVRDTLEKTFPAEYGVSDIKKLSIKIQQFEPELERLRLLSQSYEQENTTGSGDGDGQPPGGVAALGGDAETHHERISSPRSQDSTDLSELYRPKINEISQRKKGKDSQNRDDHEM